MTDRSRHVIALAIALATVACIPTGPGRWTAPSVVSPGQGEPSAAVRLAASPRPADPSSGASCAHCTRTELSDEERGRVAERIAMLKELGAPCATYAELLEHSLRSGRVTIRPFMWRVGHQLVSGEAYPNGTIFLARDIDALNVGRRTFDELLWTLEHEAAHLAFQLDAPFDRAPGDRADAVVRRCRS